MGWKGTVRSMNAAAKRSSREAQVRENNASRAHAKIDKNVEQVVTKAKKFESRLSTDPIKTLGLRYQEGFGFSSEPFELSTELFSGSVSLTSSLEPNSLNFSPSVFNTDRFSVTPLDVMFTRWGTILAVRIENHDPEYRIRTPWFKKTDPQSSLIYLLDTQNSSYYYPIASSLSGEILAGHPKVGLIAFESFRFLTNSFQIQISDVKMTAERGQKYSFDFALSDESLGESIQGVAQQESLSTEIETALLPQVKALRTQMKSSGCLVFLVGLIAASAFGVSQLSRF